MTQQENGRALIPAGADLRSIIPTNFDEVTRFAKLAVMAGLFTEERRRSESDADPEENRPIARATMAILQGLEIGVPPIQALQNIAIINGRAAMWGDLIPGLLRKHGCRIKEWQTGTPYQDDYTAHCEITRQDGEVISYTFSVADAKQAGLWDERPVIKRRGKDGQWFELKNDSPWHRYPKRMLINRARGYAARDGCADMLRGLYVREDLEDMERFEAAIDITPHKQEPFLPPQESEEPEQATDTASEPFLPPGLSETAEEPAAPRQTAESLLAEMDRALGQAGTLDELGDVWERYDERRESVLSRPQREAAADLYTKHEQRIGGA